MTALRVVLVAILTRLAGPALCMAVLWAGLDVNLTDPRLWMRIATLDALPDGRYQNDPGYRDLLAGLSWTASALGSEIATSFAEAQVTDTLRAWPRIDTREEAVLAASVAASTLLSLLWSRSIANWARTVLYRNAWRPRSRRAQPATGQPAPVDTAPVTPPVVAARARPAAGLAGGPPPREPAGEPDTVALLSEIMPKAGWVVLDASTVERLIDEKPSDLRLCAAAVGPRKLWLIGFIGFAPAPTGHDLDPARLAWLDGARAEAYDAADYLRVTAARLRDLVSEALNIEETDLEIEDMLAYDIQPGKRVGRVFVLDNGAVGAMTRDGDLVPAMAAPELAVSVDRLVENELSRHSPHHAPQKVLGEEHIRRGGETLGAFAAVNG